MECGGAYFSALVDVEKKRINVFAVYMVILVWIAQSYRLNAGLPTRYDTTQLKSTFQKCYGPTTGRGPRRLPVRNSK